MNLFERADAALGRLRSTVAGEAAWVIALSGLVTIHLAALVPAFARPDLIDFSAFVDNARGWLAGTPYPSSSRDPNTPHAILAFVPFVFLPIRVGLAIWFGITYVCLLLTLRAVSRELDLRMSAPLRLTLLVFALAAPPSWDVFVNGNMIWPLALGVTWAWRLARHGDLTRAAAVLGALATMKPFLGLLGLVFLVRREWRALAAMAIAAMVTLGVAIAVTGPTAFSAWLDALGRIGWYGVRFNASVLGALARVWRPDPLVWVVALLVIASVTAVVLARRRADISWDWLFVYLAALLASPLGWRYYLCLSVGPLVAALLAPSIPKRAVVSLCLLLISPAFSVGAGSTLALATVGSIPMWAALGAWVTLSTTYGSERVPD